MGWYIFLEAYGLYYSHTHTSKGYLVHGPYVQRHTCLDLWQCTNFKQLPLYITRCGQRTCFQFADPYGVYYSYIQSWTDTSKGYLVHRRYSHWYTSLENAHTASDWLGVCLTRRFPRADFHLGKPMVRTICTVNLGPISPSASWYMYLNSNNTLVYMYENAQSNRLAT